MNNFIYTFKVRSVFYFVLAVIFLKLLVIGFVPLVDDEMYYVVFSNHLDFGYIDHGPIISLIIWLFTVLSEHAFFVRIGSVLMFCLILVTCYQFCKQYFNVRVGRIIVIFLATSFAFHINAVIMTPDVPVAFFTIFAIIYYYKSYFISQKYFYIAGLFLGLALLSKISALFPALGIFLYPIIDKRARKSLKNKNYYLSFIIAFLILLPFIIWNIYNDFAFIRYQFGHVNKDSASISSFIEIWGATALLMGPFFFYYSIFLPIKYLFKLDEVNSSYIFFSAVSIVPTMYFFVQSIFSELLLNWPAPIFYSTIFLFCIHIDKNWQSEKLKFRFQIVYSFLLILFITVQTFSPILLLKGKSDPTNRFYKYSSFSKSLKGIVVSKPEFLDLRIVSNNFQIPSAINYYLKPDIESICLSIKYHKTIFSFLYPDEDLIGKDFLYVHRGKKFSDKVIPYFDSIELVDTITSYRDRIPVNIFSVWHVKNYNIINN